MKVDLEKVILYESCLKNGFEHLYSYVSITTCSKEYWVIWIVATRFGNRFFFFIIKVFILINVSGHATT